MATNFWVIGSRSLYPVVSWMVWSMFLKARASMNPIMDHVIASRVAGVGIVIMGIILYYWVSDI